MLYAKYEPDKYLSEYMSMAFFPWQKNETLIFTITSFKETI